MSGILEGKVGIITGALGGLGQAMCKAFRAAGARVALLDLNGSEARKQAEFLGGGAMGVGLDITNEVQVHEAVQEVSREFGGLDFLVNNAGIRHEISFLEHDLERWRRTIDVNITGTFLCAQAAARVMVQRGGGKIVNISSITGLSAFRNRAAYVTSKTGVIGLTRAIAWELGPKGIYCNAIAPGVVETPLTAHYFTNAPFAELIKENTPIMRWGQPNDIAQPALFLCSSASDFVQGTTLTVDGGWLSGKAY